MEKKSYYIAVGSNEILEPSEAAGTNFEFEIQATEDELDRLQELFEDKTDSEEDTAVRALTPYRLYHKDEENDAYDWNLTEIYRMIHELGTPETRRHIESMNVLP